MPSPPRLRRRPPPELGEPGGLLHAVRQNHPRWRVALRADVEAALAYRSERATVEDRWRLALQALRLVAVTDTFGAQCCYRAKAAAQRAGVPVLPRILHHLAISWGGICIGDPVIVEPGVYIPHGQVVVDGFTRIGPRTVLSPFVTVGLTSGHPVGPTLGTGAYLGTGAKVFGPVTVGDGAKVGANAVVAIDVPAGATAVGVPARVIPATSQAAPPREAHG